MNFTEFLKNNWHEILVLTQEHLFITLLATGLAVSIGLPLGIFITRFKALQAPVLGFANVMQTVPSLALFGLLIPIPFIGGIGARTAVIALALYALLPVIRNTVTGILGIDRRLIESADAMGMTGWQRMRLLELPLAMPVIITGVRVAVVISVGVATVAAAIGAGGLGTYIFRGLRQNDNNLLIAGALASALLALLCDYGLGQIERAFSVSKRKGNFAGRILGPVVGITLIGIVFLGFIPGFKSKASNLENKDQIELPTGGRKIVVGSKDFSESIILAEILSQMLEKQGLEIIRQFELGGNLVHEALIAKQIDVYPEYTGTAYTAILKKTPKTEPIAVYDETKSEYESRFGLTLSAPLGFANDFAILVRGNVARSLNLNTISDAVPISRDWQAGFGQDFMSRADGYAGFAGTYGFRFAKQPREMDLALTYRALASGELDMIAGNSTDGLISALDLFQLEDDRRYFPPYQAVFVVRKEVEATLQPILDRLGNSISTDEMRGMNLKVDGDKQTPKDVAADFIRRTFP